MAAGPPLGQLGEALGTALAARLAAAAEAIRFPAGEAVIVHGETLGHLYVVGEGILAAELRDHHNLPIEVRRFARGDYAGEMAFLQGERASATVRALTDATVWRIPHAVLHEVANESPALMRELCRELAVRLSDTNKKVRQLRNGRLVVIAVDSRVAGEVAAAAIAEAARLLGDAVVLVDRTGLVEGPDFRSPGETADSELEPALAHAVAAVAAHSAGAVHLGPPHTAITPAVLMQAVARLRRADGLVVVCGEAGWLKHSGVIDDADCAFLIEERAEPTQGGETLPVVLVRPAGPGVPPARLSIFGKEHGRTVLRVVPHWSGPESGTSTARAEPRASIAWLARHILAKKVGIALGAGGSKGYAHLGALEELRALGVEPDYVVGCSIGAPVATAYVHGIPFATGRSWLDRTFARSIRMTLPYRSLLSSRLLQRDMDSYFDGVRLEDQPIPLGLVAVDLDARREVVFRRGPAARAIVASMAIPGIYPPVRSGKRRLVDGGLLNPVPIRTVAASGADVVIGVKLTSPVVDAPQGDDHRVLRAPPIVDTIQHAFEVMQWRIVLDGAAQADIPIEPVFLGTTGLRDFARADEFIEAGRAAVRRAEPSIRKWLPWTR